MSTQAPLYVFVYKTCNVSLSRAMFELISDNEYYALELEKLQLADYTLRVHVC